MKGFVEFHLYNSFSDYKLTLKRKLTVIRGDSATGKTTMIQMLNDALEYGTVSIDCKYKCMVLTDFTWKYIMNVESDCLYFIDEQSNFIYTNLFAQMYKESSGYFVIITRKDIESLPYSVNSIYRFKNSGRYNTIENIYNFDNDLFNGHLVKNVDAIVCEDSGAGLDFYKSMVGDKFDVCSCLGKSNVVNFILNNYTSNRRCIIVVDGAAFGSNISIVHQLCKQYRHSLFIPESFEYVLLHINRFNYYNVICDEYRLASIIGSDYISWEEFFTDELINRTANTEFSYKKSHINKAYTSHTIYTQLSKYFDAIKLLYTSNKDINVDVHEDSSKTDRLSETSIFIKPF